MPYTKAVWGVHGKGTGDPWHSPLAETSKKFTVDFVKLVTVLQISAYVLVCSGQL